MRIAPRWRKATVAVVVTIFASTLAVSLMPAHAAPELTLAVLASTGECGNSISMSAMDKARSSEGGSQGPRERGAAINCWDDHSTPVA